MAAILRKAWQAYHFLFEELSDPRTKDWLFVAKPYQCLTLLSLYLMFVFKWGPKWMKNRQPFNLDKILIAYNAFQVAACSYVFINGIYLGWGWHYKWICEPVDYSNNPRALAIAKCSYVYLLLKIVDLLDTVFFVLRKKNNQVSFLHIYHHTGMVLLIWGAVTYVAGGHGTLIGVINSFVHVAMYSYYLLSVAIPSTKNVLWIKKFVTQLQILQFFFYVVHMSTIVFKSDCEYPRWISAIFLPQNFFMLVLFSDFYIKTYIRKPKQRIAAKNNAVNGNNQNNINENIAYNNGVTTTKIQNGFNKLKHENNTGDVNNYFKNDLRKRANGHDNVYNNNNNGFSENVNIFENGIYKSSCLPAKCKINCHKHDKNE